MRRKANAGPPCALPPEAAMSARRQTFERELNAYGRLVIAPMGDSMWPMLRDRRDTLVLERPKQPLRRRDVALYEDAHGVFVLHRVWAVGPDAYTFCGDSRYELEPGVRATQIVGVMTGFFRGERYVTVTRVTYQLYARIWSSGFGMRRWVARLAALRRRWRAGACGKERA